MGANSALKGTGTFEFAVETGKDRPQIFDRSREIR
jgi:hypothetical protein